MDFTEIGTAVGSAAAVIGTIGTAIWVAIQKMRRDKAETKAAIAEDLRDRSVADSQKIIYDMLSGRLSSVENELREMKMYTRKLELHISRLEKTMREQGLEVPEFHL